MNLRMCGGRVPVFVGGDSPYLLVEFPTKDEFMAIFKRTQPEIRERHWEVLKSRREGKTLIESGKPFGLTRERVRQIEAKFIRKVGERYFERLSFSETDSP